jgi:hypothetical protein
MKASQAQYNPAKKQMVELIKKFTSQKFQEYFKFEILGRDRPNRLRARRSAQDLESSPNSV